ncbi:MAG: restriction endonuclease subunit S [Oscillospiraceae bacterium]|nr:restriction endonuclease subunit S [Oscillospiraceae bacterium]
MDKWKTKTLGEVTSYIAKGIPPKYVEKENENTIRVLNQKCNRDFRISYADSRLHDSSLKAVPPEKMLISGDVLINSTGTGTAGRVAQIWDVSVPTTIDGHMILMRPTEEIDVLYYGYAVKAHQQAIESYAEGSTGQTEINKTRLQNEIVIQFPEDKNEQRKIGKLLANLDEKIIENEQINKNLEEQAQALFKSWFVDFEPFGGVMPEGCYSSTLGDVTEMGAGGDKPKISSNVKTTECPYPIYSNGLDNEGLYGYTDKPKISNESVTVSARGTIGFVCLRHIPYVPIVRLVSLVPNTDIISAKYLYLFLKQLHISGTGTTQQQLTVPDFRKTEILVPDIAVMRKFTNIVNPMFEGIWANQMENEKLASLRDSLLPKLMSGEIDVSNVSL